MDTQRNIFVCMGAPCSGKGTQSRILAESIDACRVEAGVQLDRIIRGEISPELSEAAAKVRTSVRSVSAEDLNAISRAQLGTAFGNETQDVVLDGFGRNRESYKLLCNVFGRELITFLYFRVSKDVIKKRAATRYIHPETRKSYSFDNPSEANQIGLIRRESDSPEVIGRRYSNFQRQAVSVMDEHQRHGGAVIEISAGYPEVERVANIMFKRIQEQLPGIEFNVS